MTKRYNSWIPTRKRFIAFMDIVGFEDMIFRKSHDEVKKNLELFQSIIAGPQTKGRYLFGGSVVKLVFFSDSILLMSSSDSLRSAKRFFTLLGGCLARPYLRVFP